jgi:hypothetical protein
MQLDDWNDLQCDCCDDPATHVCVDLKDTLENVDVVILKALCDECYGEEIWIHRECERKVASMEKSSSPPIKMRRGLSRKS